MVIKWYSSRTYIYLPVTGARQQGGEAFSVLGHAVDSISVAVQGGYERLGKNPLQFGGIQGPGVLSAHLKRMKCGVIVSRD